MSKQDREYRGHMADIDALGLEYNPFAGGIKKPHDHDRWVQLEETMAAMINYAVKPLKEQIEQLGDENRLLRFELDQRMLVSRLSGEVSGLERVVGDLDRRVAIIEATPSARPAKKQPINAQGIPQHGEWLKITCQVFDNRPMTSEKRKQHLTEYEVKLEVVTTGNMMFRTNVATYTPKHFLHHKKRAAVGLSDDVTAFLTYAHCPQGHLVGMVLTKPPRGGSHWMAEQVLVLHFDRGRPIVRLLSDGELVEFTDFKDGHGTAGAAKWIATWHRSS